VLSQAFSGTACQRTGAHRGRPGRFARERSTVYTRACSSSDVKYIQNIHDASMRHTLLAIPHTLNQVVTQQSESITEFVQHTSRRFRVARCV
jgi:hypothetical protein